MGVVIIEGFKNRELGKKQFAEALAIEPGIAMTPALVTPEISEAFDEAKEQSTDDGGRAVGRLVGRRRDRAAPPAARDSAAHAASSSSGAASPTTPSAR